MSFADVFCDGAPPIVTLPTGEFQLDIEFLPFACELIDEFIEKVNSIWVSIAEDTESDPATPWDITPGANIERAIKMIFLPESRVGREFLQYVPDSMMNRGYIYGIMCNHGFEPKIKDIVIYNDQHLTVHSVNPIQPVDQSIVYIVVMGA